jgi:ribonuclease J
LATPLCSYEEKSIKIEIYGGCNEIGGNSVVILDRGSDRKIVFDNGIRFSILRKFYRGSISPLGAAELWSVGAIPPKEIFEDADAVYITHFHLDHLGLLGLLPDGVRVYVPSKEVLESIADRYRRSGSWLNYIAPSQYLDIRSLEPFREDEFGVTPIPVSHSSYPSLSLIYRGSDSTIFYSGDLRVRGFQEDMLGVDTIRNIAWAVDNVLGGLGADFALLEGTNFSDVETPLSPQEFRSILWRILDTAALATISIDHTDLEILLDIIDIASMKGRKVVIASPRIISTIDSYAHVLKSKHLKKLSENISIATIDSIDEPPPLGITDITFIDDILRSPENYILIQDPIDFLEIIRREARWGKDVVEKAIVLLTNPEPMDMAREEEERVLASWLYRLGVQIYRIRVSGHYYPHELREIITSLKPNKLIPIHTEAPDTMISMFKKIKNKPNI